MANYDYWHAALAGTFGPVHDSDPQLGFWRKRNMRNGPFVPVAIFEHEGKIVALVNGVVADAAELWTFVCRNPVTEESYHAKMRGEPWSDEDASVTQSVQIGHNAPPTDEADLLRDQIQAASANATEYADIRDDATASKAQSSRARLLELSGEADKKREAAKKPHLEAGKAIDARWQPLVKLAKEAADKIRTALSAHETRKFQEQEKARKAAEEAARKAAEANQPPPPTPPSVPAPEPVTQIRGAHGRAASIKVVKVAHVTNPDALFGFLKTHKELIELMARLAQRAVDAGHSPPGVEISQERRVA